MGDDRFVFKGLQRVLQLGEAAEVAAGDVLSHDGEVDTISEQIFDAVQHVEAILRVRRKHQVADGESFFEHAVFVRDVGYLFAHFQEGFFAVFAVIRRAAVTQGELVVEVFVIGEIDVHVAVKRGDRFLAFVPAAVVEDGNGGAIDVQGVLDHGDVGRRGDEVDVVRAVVFQTAKNVGKPLSVKFIPLYGKGDLLILAEGAL